MSQISPNISIDIGSESDSSPDDIASILDSLIDGGILELSSYPLLLFVLLQDFESKFPSPNCVNVIISSVCSFEDVAYGMYDTTGHIATASEYGCDVYANVLD